MKTLIYSSVNEYPQGASSVWGYIQDFLEKENLLSAQYEVLTDVGRKSQYDLGKFIKIPSQNVMSTIRNNNEYSFTVNEYKRGNKEGLNIYYTNRQEAKSIAGRFFIADAESVLPFEKWDSLFCEMFKHGILRNTVLVNGEYHSRQNCKDIAFYSRKYGSVDGLKLIDVELPPPLPTKQIDISSNLGRVIQGQDIYEAVSAEMWLGETFWPYAACKKEDVLQSDWLKSEDRGTHLHVVAWPEPFSSSAGIQGDVQKRLFKLLFGL